MSRVRRRGEEIRRFILEEVTKHPAKIGGVAAERFGITRQAVNKHLKNLVAEGAISPEGKTRSRTYKLCSIQEWRKAYPTQGLAEDVIWTQDIMPLLANLPDNVRDIWYYCFTEMSNNAIDHSGSPDVLVHIGRTAADTRMLLIDRGVGIFRKIQTAMNLANERHAILELSKGKLTTDPAKHTGHGIFFTSRMLDSFDILSGGVSFSHVFGNEEDWLLERPQPGDGTAIFMRLSNHTARTGKQILDQYSSVDDLGFVKTVVPVKLAQYGEDRLISRSQAKRVLARVEVFKEVLLDFEGVPTIGQAFADEVFRVFPRSHPTVTLLPIRTNPEVQRMIESAKTEHPQDLPTDLASL